MFLGKIDQDKKEPRGNEGYSALLAWRSHI